MDKFDSNKHSKLLSALPFSYFSSSLYLDFSAYVLQRNGEDLIVWQDSLYPNEFPCIFMPAVKNNWEHAVVTFATSSDIQNLSDQKIEIVLNKPMGSEYYYNTSDFVNPSGSFKNRVSQFEDGYEYSVKKDYEKSKILEFYSFWKSQRKHESITFEESEEFFLFCLENLDKYGIKTIYVEIDNKLVGLGWGIEFPNSNRWIGLHLKVNYEYKGLSRFIHQERAKLFEDLDEFSLGTGAHDKGIDQYKEELGPILKKEYFYIITGGKLSA